MAVAFVMYCFIFIATVLFNCHGFPISLEEKKELTDVHSALTSIEDALVKRIHRRYSNDVQQQQEQPKRGSSEVEVTSVKDKNGILKRIQDDLDKIKAIKKSVTVTSQAERAPRLPKETKRTSASTTTDLGKRLVNTLNEYIKTIDSRNAAEPARLPHLADNNNNDLESLLNSGRNAEEPARLPHRSIINSNDDLKSLLISSSNAAGPARLPHRELDNPKFGKRDNNPSISVTWARIGKRSGGCYDMCKGKFELCVMKSSQLGLERAFFSKCDSDKEECYNNCR